LSVVEARHQRFRRLIEPVHAGAVAFARGLCRSRADGDDLMQEALLRALDKLDALRDEAAFKRWLYRIVITVHRDRCRRAFWRRLLPLGDTDAASTARPDDELGGAQRARLALASLPAEMRETIVLHEIEGWQVDEIAGVLGVSSSAVKSRLSRGRDRLRTFYLRTLGAEGSTQLQGETP
jgi:RNA polymerase sigma-70 factor (ECF subfamily)